MIKIELLSETNFCLESLDSYNRKQDVNKVYRRIDGEYALVECKYTEDWDLEKKRSVAKKISGDECIAYLALENNKVVGFIGLLKKLSGPYMILDMMHVSSECRGQGIGRLLFEAGKAEARKAGAEALYISACSSEETIAFYRAMGSELASKPIKEIAEEEPFDLQMVCPVMHIVKAEENQIEKIVDMSIRAFETDVNVGGAKGDCPPEFDSVEWHKQMAREGHLYQAMIGKDLVGAAIVFPDETEKSVYIGRIFIDSACHRKGYGIRLMECIENNFPCASEFNLDTPCWNERTNAFYKKLGYRIIKTEDGFVFYQKRVIN